MNTWHEIWEERPEGLANTELIAWAITTVADAISYAADQSNAASALDALQEIAAGMSKLTDDGVWKVKLPRHSEE